MKPILLLSVVAMAFGYRNQNNGTTSSFALADTIQPSFFNPHYSSSFAIGKQESANTVLRFWKNWDNNEMDKSYGYLADTVEFIFPDGSRLSGHKKAVWNDVKAYRSGFIQMRSEVDALLPVKITDKGHFWVAIWGREYHISSDGKQDSTDLHEVWRFNKAGKVIGMSQYGAGVNVDGKRRL